MANAQRHASVAGGVSTVLLCCMNGAPGDCAEAPPPNLRAHGYFRDDPGAGFTPAQTTIKLWPPPAKSVAIALFDNPTTDSFQATPMERDANRVWSATIKGNLDGKYYLYDVTHSAADSARENVVRVTDPYARGSSANSARA